MKVIVQLWKNAYAFDLSLTKVRLRDSRDEDDEEFEDDEEVAEDGTPMRHDPTGSSFAQVERAQPDVDMANTHHCDEIRAYKGFGFGKTFTEQHFDPGLVGDGDGR